MYDKLKKPVPSSGKTPGNAREEKSQNSRALPSLLAAATRKSAGCVPAETGSC